MKAPKDLTEIKYALEEHVAAGNIDAGLVVCNQSIESCWSLLKSLWLAHPKRSAGTYDLHLRTQAGAQAGEYTPARAADLFDAIELRMIAILSAVAKSVTAKNREYNESWFKRGGVGAYMMLARKIDRMENYVQPHGFDILKALAADTRPEGIIDDIQDLIGYLGLVLEKHQSMSAQAASDAAWATSGYVNQD